MSCTTIDLNAGGAFAAGTQTCTTFAATEAGEPTPETKKELDRAAFPVCSHAAAPCFPCAVFDSKTGACAVGTSSTSTPLFGEGRGDESPTTRGVGNVASSYGVCNTYAITGVVSSTAPVTTCIEG